jgi:hypothetical protein
MGIGQQHSAQLARTVTLCCCCTLQWGCPLPSKTEQLLEMRLVLIQRVGSKLLLVSQWLVCVGRAAVSPRPSAPRPPRPPVSRKAPINTVLVSASTYSPKMLFRAMIRLETQGQFEGGVVQSMLTDSFSWVHPNPTKLILCLVDDRHLAVFRSSSGDGLSVALHPSVPGTK